MSQLEEIQEALTGLDESELTEVSEFIAELVAGDEEDEDEDEEDEEDEDEGGGEVEIDEEDDEK